jgi:hypothetical protein
LFDKPRAGYIFKTLRMTAVDLWTKKSQQDIL